MATPALTVGIVAKMTAKADTADEVAKFLADAVALANDEAGTIVWFGLQTDPTTFWIVDAFATEDDRQTHIGGAIASALMANADRLLASPPEIALADILGVKVP